jgi:hypothetical protein
MILISITIISILSCKTRNKKKIPVSEAPPVGSDPIYEIPLGTKDVEVEMTPSVAYGVGTLTNKKEVYATQSEQQLHESEQPLYENGPLHKQPPLYKNEQPLYKNEQPLNHEQSDYYI